MALRAAVSVGVPLLILWLTGHLSWAMYAAFGAFTAVYGRNLAGGPRLRMQARVGVFLTLSVLLGVVVGLSEARTWLAVPVATAVAGAAAAVSDRQQWHPPGPLFAVFAFAACASVPSVLPDVVSALLVAAASATWAVLLGGLGTWLRAQAVPRGEGTDKQSSPTAEPAGVRELRHVLRAMIAVAVAGTLATASGIGHPYWAMVSAVVPVTVRTWQGQWVRGLQRVVGTGVGLLVAGGLLVADLPAVALLVAVIVLQASAELLIGRNYAVALIAITPLALLMIALVTQAPTGVLLGDRAVETVIGVVVGVAVGWLTRRRS